jgi:hypothetical protein
MATIFSVDFFECPDRNPVGRKFIVVGTNDCQTMWIFPTSFQHIEVYQRKSEKIISAGLIRDDDGFIECYGESTSLYARARRDDTKLLNAFLGENP